MISVDVLWVPGLVIHGWMLWASRSAMNAFALYPGLPLQLGTSSGWSGKVLIRLSRAGWSVSPCHVGAVQCS